MEDDMEAVSNVTRDQAPVNFLRLKKDLKA